MSTLVLIALLAAAFTLQVHLDRRSIAALARRQRWSALKISWTPLRGWTRSRQHRGYALRYRDESGRPVQRGCWAIGFLASSIELEPPAGEQALRGAPRKPMGRLAFVTVSMLVGGFLGLQLGIGACLLLFPGSNIAPAYGVLFVAPVGLVAGALFGMLRTR